ncbi:flavin monoamine oxidase family protein [Oxobacter pfennigii]|nr:FAD-dependent oxidoreductase [Oxobacter pfennigii]
MKPSYMRQTAVTLPDNPTDEQRHEMLRNALIEEGRLEDYENIILPISPPPEITRHTNPGEFKGLRVGIVGGGVAGMTAAFELRKLGFDITVFEPNTERVGGRIYTHYFDKEKKLYGELGAGRIPASHDTVWHYINLFKLDTKPIISSNSNAYIYIRGIRIRTDPKGEGVFNSVYPRFNLNLKEAETPWPELYNQVTKHYLSTLPPEIRRQLLMILPRYNYQIEMLQDISTRQAMERYGLSSEAINLITGLMPSLGGLIGNSYESELHSEYTIDYQNLYSIAGGMVNLPLAFYNSLISPNPKEYAGIPREALGKVTWKAGFVANGITQSDKEGKITVRYRKVPVLEDIYEDFDYVICALPFTILRVFEFSPDFSQRKMQAFKEIYYQDAQKTLFLCRNRFWEKQGIFRGSSITDETIGMIEYPQDHALCTENDSNHSPDEPGVLTASYNIGNDAGIIGNLPPISQYHIIGTKVELVHGLPRWYLHKNKIIIDSKTVNWTRESFFSGAFQFFLPGQKREFLEVSSTPEYNNRVFFTGDHTSPKNGWIQGALRSAMRIASDVAYYAIIHKYKT